MNNISSTKTDLTGIYRLILLGTAFLAFLHIVYYNFRYIFDRELKLGYIIHNSSFLILSALMITLTTTGFILTGLIAGRRHLSAKSYTILLVVTAFGLRLAFILFYNSAPISDFILLYRTAKELVKGNFDFIKNSQYYLAWVYQLGFVSYQALVIKIFGQGYLALKVFNVVFSTGTCVLVYLTGKRAFNETTGRIAGIAYCLYPSSIYMCTVLTNQIFSAFLFYFALYMAAGKIRKYSFVMLGLLIALGNIIRPEGPVILIAIIVYLLLFKKEAELFHVGKGQGIRIFQRPIIKKGCIIAGVLVTFFIITRLFDIFLLSTGISNYPMSNRNPLWKFVVGFNYDEKGLYNKADDQRVSQFPLGGKRNAEELKIIKERIKDKKKLLLLMQLKTRIFWSDFDHTLTNYVVPGTNLTPYKNNVLLYLEKCYYTAITLFVLVSLAFLFFKKERSGSSILYLILILGFMFIYLFIEIQLRYRYLILPAFFLMSSFGIYSVSSHVGLIFSRAGKSKISLNQQN